MLWKKKEASRKTTTNHDYPCNHFSVWAHLQRNCYDRQINEQAQQRHFSFPLVDRDNVFVDGKWLRGPLGESFISAAWGSAQDPDTLNDMPTRHSRCEFQSPSPTRKLGFQLLLLSSFARVFPGRHRAPKMLPERCGHETGARLSSNQEGTRGDLKVVGCGRNG